MFNQYILILVWIGFMAFQQKNYCRAKYSSLTSKLEWRVIPSFAFLVFIPVIIMATNRGWFADTSAYISRYRSMPDSLSDVFEYAVNLKKDKGFYFVSAILRCILGYNYLPYLFVIAFFQGSSLIHFFRKYSKNYVFSIFLFITSADYISWMYNGIRQFTAVTIILFATPYMIKKTDRYIRKKYLPLIIIIIIASTMHKSALLMIPFVIIAQGEAFNLKTLSIMIPTILAVAFVGEFSNLLDDALSNTQYVNVVSDYTSWNDDGTNPLRVLVYSVPALLAIVNYKKVRKCTDSVINFSINMSLISMALYLISMVTSGIFLGRLPIYCSLFSYILLPWEIDSLFSENKSKIIKIAAVVGYIAYYYYAMHFQNGLI